jgi:hypothetical protein
MRPYELGTVLESAEPTTVIMEASESVPTPVYRIPTTPDDHEPDAPLGLLLAETAPFAQ